MILCERCAAIVAYEEREEREIAAILPSHLHLYDFGDGVTTMPVPDFSDQGSYLTYSICFVHDDDVKKFLGFCIDYKKTGPKRGHIIDDSNFLERLKEAVDKFPTKSWDSVNEATKNALHRGMRPA